MEFNCTLIRRKTCATVIVGNPPKNREMLMHRLQEISFTVKSSPDLSVIVMVVPLGTKFAIMWGNLTWGCGRVVETDYIEERTENHA